MKQTTKNLKQIIKLDSDLNKIQDLDILLERILFETRRVARAEAGSIYIRKDDKLFINYAQNDELQGRLPPGKKLIYSVFSVEIDDKTISGYAAKHGELLNIPDMYKIPSKAPYSFNPKFDQISKYKTVSTLTIPLKTNTGEILGVIQVINSKDGNGNIMAFTQDDELLVTHFANSATTALQRAQMTRAILLRMIKMAELRDPKETGPHVNRVAGFAIEIYEHWAYRHNISRQEMENTMDNLRMAAMLHDVGKVAISDTILKKPARFTEDEFEIMKTHTVHGARLFIDKQSAFDDMAAIVAQNHHESWDGSGYPGYLPEEVGDDLQKIGVGKIREEIPLFGRIVAIADVFDALRSKRVYKEAWDETQVLQEIKSLSGVKFDPELVEVFLDVLPSLKTVVEKYPDEPLH
ncbi:MAG: HD domain-containing protein [Spirochaetales bacterium]|nr:MAG: HD domain-containing protein [Spirochaetales bacterium]